MTTRPFDGKNVIITGAASGIGEAAALIFAARGASVSLLDLNEERLHAVAVEITRRGGHAISVATDVSDASSVLDAHAAATSAFGAPLMAFNNAGIAGFRGAPVDHPPGALDELFRVNVGGAWNCIRAQLPAMLDARQGSIVNNASALGLIGNPGAAAYVASKHAIVGLTKAVALDHARDGIRVNCVCPGIAMTPLVRQVLDGNPEYESRWMDAQPIGRFATAAEVAEAAVWLCSDSASFVTGLAMPVDGGMVVA